uniref:sterile alpha motif domain-containing protein 3-like isoform X2 n=1 Tax=Epinephelus lanceolatus TaxID=310571 RepID=UPI0014450DE6|nr:sterile alpha motif domain-containing protein 3-like isoform X2 [Epinephelus lanceolatus]
MIEYTMYPTNAEYVQVVQTLIAKYPFLKDLEGNGYHTWHQSLKRKFKAERAPLVHQDEVRRVKEKFGHKRKKSTLTDAAEKWHRFVSGLWEEVNRLHPSSVELCRRWREGFTGIVPKVMKLVGERSPLAKMYSEAREELLAEELPGILLFYVSSLS